MEEKFTSVKDFLAKPYLVTTVNWTTATAAGGNLWSVATESWFNGGGQNITPWTEKLRGFNLFKGDLHLRFESTANKFQQGLGIASFIPCASTMGTTKVGSHRATLNGIFQLPHVVINVEDSAAEITIPYIAPTSHFDVLGRNYSWGSVWLDVASPLLTGAAGQTSISVLVYAWIDNLSLTAPIFPQMDMSEAEDVPLSRALLKVSSAASSFNSVPMISSIAKTTSWVARAASGAASAFGYSKPKSELPPEPIARQQWRYNGVCEGPNMSIPLGLSYDTQVATLSHSIRKMDEMNLKFLYSIPNYYSQVSWTTSQAPGTSLYSLDLNPSTLGVTGSLTYTGHTALYLQGSPMVYLSQFFNMWRGSFRVKIKVVKTSMHKGRLEFTWTPSQFSTITSPTTATSVFSLRHVIDIAEKDEVVLNLPYMINTPYLNVHGNRFNTAENRATYSGRFLVRTLNQLRCPETCSSSVNVMLFIEPGDDFEYAVPGNSAFNTTGTTGPTTATVPFIIQMDLGDDDREVIISEGIGGTQIKRTTLQEVSMCIGEKITSIKQLLLRMSPVYFPGIKPGNANSVAIWPYFSGTYTMSNVSGLIVLPTATGDPFSYLKPCYAFYRGSVNMSVSPNADIVSGPASIGVSLTPGFAPAADSVMGVYGGENNSIASVNPFNVSINLGTSITETDHGLGLVSANVPYYSRTPVALSTNDTITIPLGRADCPISIVNFVNNTSNVDALSDSVFYRSVGDDFQFLYFLSCPPIMYSYT
jgi:hypothetical protein